jgi:hypothetical protein
MDMERDMIITFLHQGIHQRIAQSWQTQPPGVVSAMTVQYVDGYPLYYTFAGLLDKLVNHRFHIAGTLVGRDLAVGA